MKIRLFQSLKHDKWVKPFIKRYRKSLVLALFLGFLTLFCGGALMFNSGYLISRSASLPENILLVYIPIVLTRAFGIGRPVFRYLERLVSHNWVLKMTSDLRLRLYRVADEGNLTTSNKVQTGKLLGLLSEDINHIQNLYLRTIFPTVIGILLYVTVVVALGWFSLWFALVILLALGIEVIFYPLVSVIVNGARLEKQKSYRRDLYSELTDNVLGVSDWVFSQRGAEYVTQHEKNEAVVSKIEAKNKQFSRNRDFILQVVFGMIVLLVLWWTSIVFKGNHGGKANWIAAFVLAIFPLIDAFLPLSSAAEETNLYADSIDRLNDLPDLTEEKSGWQPKKPLGEEIQIRNVFFSYNQTEPVLQNLSLNIQAGEKLAILGKSGSGKSTLASLIYGEYKPFSGEVKIGGVETYELKENMVEYVGVIHQTPYLFHTTVLNNVRIGNEEATETEVWKALEDVGLKELVSSLPDGINTQVDEAGLRFSGGERHRLALARILLQDTPIIILDEPTVGLDPITEATLLKTFFRTLSTKTVIWITHHLLGVEEMDRVVFIEEGKAEMEGTPEELAATNKRYQLLYKMDRGE